MDEPIRAPRLGIVHLLAWTFASAFCMAAYRWSNIYADVPDFMAPIYMAQLLIHGMAFGAGVTAMCGMLQSWSISRRGMWHPGYWLVVIQTTGAVQLLVLLVATPFLRDGFIPQSIYYSIVAVASLPTVCIYILATVFATNASWRAVFLLGCGTSLLSAIQYLAIALSMLAVWGTLNVVGNVVTAIAFLLLLSVCCVDLAKRIPRDWIHWTGIATNICHIFLALSLQLWVMLARPN
ncbi:MAG: hypothetical protein R3E01_21885 [Pirellulaceae bacterium]|nr:hypothetical protein [Planctomycetales bacterium]